jgi:hypothetical protein
MSQPIDGGVSSSGDDDSIWVMRPDDQEAPMTRSHAFRNATVGFFVATLGLLVLHALLA